MATLAKEVMEQMVRLGFDFRYVLNNDKRVEYVSGMFVILGKAATKKNIKRTGNEQLPWDKWYELTAVEVDDYRSSLKKSLPRVRIQKK